MAIPTATRTVYDNALRHVYTPKLWQLQNRDRILLKKFQRDTAQYAEGKQINIRLHTAGSGGVGWSTGTLPASGTQLINNAYANYKKLYGRFKIDGDLIAGTRTGYAAEMRALAWEARNLVEDLAQALAYDIWQDASGQVSGSTASNPSGGASTSSIRVPIANNGIRKNMIVDVLKTDGTASTQGKAGMLVSSVAVDSADATLYLITFDTTNGPALGGTGDMTSGGPYAVYRQGSYGNAIDGVSKIVSTTGTYLGINRGTAGNEFWKAQSLANGGTNRPIQLELMQEMLDTIETNSPGATNLIVTSHAIWRKLADILVADKRHEGTRMKLDGWCEALDFRGVPVVRDKHAPANKMWFFDARTWTIYQDSEGGFIDEDNQILRMVSGEDAFEAAWRRYLQLVCHDPASNGVLADIEQ